MNSAAPAVAEAGQSRMQTLYASMSSYFKFGNMSPSKRHMATEAVSKTGGPIIEQNTSIENGGPYPIHAMCDVGPKGMPCHGKQDESTCHGQILLTQLDKNTTEVSWDLEGCGRDGLHGFHIHEKADFSNGCISAGPHYNPFGTNHGGPNDLDRHVGDMGNIQMDAKGSAKGSMKDHLVKLEGPYTVVGRSMMVHEDPDDLGLGDHSEPGTNGKTSLTTGNAGARIACGEIVTKK